MPRHIFTNALVTLFSVIYGACGLWLLVTGSIAMGVMALTIVALFLAVVHLARTVDVYRAERGAIVDMLERLADAEQSVRT